MMGDVVALRKVAVTFDDFWASYPRRVAKKDAFRAWGKVKPEDHAAIIDAIKKQMQSEAWLQDDGRYIPHAATWLNGERWTDEVEIQMTVVECFHLPDWVPEMQWQAWLDSRAKLKKAPTLFAKQMALTKLEHLKAEGHAPAAVLAQSAFNGWAGLFAIQEKR